LDTDGKIPDFFVVLDAQRICHIVIHYIGPAEGNPTPIDQGVGDAEE
jgi:hypothetical protein